MRSERGERPRAAPLRGVHEVVAGTSLEDRARLTSLQTMSSKAWLMNMALAAAAFGCGDQAVQGETMDAGVGACLRELDVLLVIDDSVSKTVIHDRLSVALPRFLQGLASGDYDHDGAPDLQAFSDVHVAVTTSNMGAYAEGVPQCSVARNDGLLLSTSLSGECKGGVYPYQIYVPNDESKPDELIQHVQCLASVGVQRCPYEQPLEAMYKALAPSRVTSFHGGSAGHGDRESKGFLRENAVLAVIHVSDDDDCSVTDSGAELFTTDPSDARLKSPASERPYGVNLRCALLADDPQMLHPVARFVDGLTALKPGHPERIVFGVLAGLPAAVDGQSARQVLALPEMTPTPDVSAAAAAGAPDALAEDQTTLKSACADARGEVTAAPAPRLVGTAAEFGENGVVRSVCADDFAPALEAIARRVGAALVTCQPALDAGA